MATSEFTASVQNPTASTVRLADVPDGLEITPVQLTAQDGALSRGMVYRLKGGRSRTGIHIMHPRADLYAHYSIVPMALAGYTVLTRMARWPNNDAATVHEMLLLDVAAGIRHLQHAGCDRVVLLGPAGGGSLAAFYQAQATAPHGGRLLETPAGDPLDLNRYDLPPSDGIILFGAHIGQGAVLAKMIDASVTDESDPESCDPALDMYSPANGFVRPPQSSRYPAPFLTSYREAQMARVARIDARAHALLARQREAAALVARLGETATQKQVRASIVEHHMIIYRAWADPAFTDLSIDPDDRAVGSYHSGRPDLANYAVEGFARVTTPRAWLSTWSRLSSNAGTASNLAKIDTPILIVHHAGDAGTRLAEVRHLLAAAASQDKTLHIVKGAEHSGFTINADGSRGPRALEGVEVALTWLQSRLPTSS